MHNKNDNDMPEELIINGHTYKLEKKEVAINDNNGPYLVKDYFQSIYGLSTNIDDSLWINLKDQLAYNRKD